MRRTLFERAASGDDGSVIGSGELERLDIVVQVSDDLVARFNRSLSSALESVLDDLVKWDVQSDLDGERMRACAFLVNLCVTKDQRAELPCEPQMHLILEENVPCADGSGGYMERSDDACGANSLTFDANFDVCCYSNHR